MRLSWSARNKPKSEEEKQNWLDPLLYTAFAYLFLKLETSGSIIKENCIIGEVSREGNPQENHAVLP